VLSTSRLHTERLLWAEKEQGRSGNSQIALCREGCLLLCSERDLRAGACVVDGSAAAGS